MSWTKDRLSRFDIIRHRNNEEPIDIIITWVDGADKDWLLEKERYTSASEADNVDDTARRYRDWGLLRYLLRSIEKFAPWTRNVHLVTWGHTPKWLNTNANKLIVTRHSDFIPAQYLPTFNSHAIEWNLHRIEGLSQNFVYFNDDMLITRPIDSSLFFQNGLPVLPPQLHGILPRADVGIMAHVYVNNVMLINRHFRFHDSLKANMRKWFNPLQIGFKAAIENAYAYSYSEFLGFRHIHVPMPLSKSVIEQIWQSEGDLINKTCMHKMRDAGDISPYVMWYWSLASGKFVPCKAKRLGKAITLREDNINDVAEAVRTQKYRLICPNDMGGFEDNSVFEQSISVLGDAFAHILRDKSSFEL